MLFVTTTLAASLLVPATEPSATPALPAPATAAPAVHCQVPCGIYGDHLRVELVREHCATIEKAMKQIAELGAAETPNWNQLVRWIQTKDEHAQKVQDQLQSYWLAQRVKEPGAGDDDAMGKYVRQLMLQHRMMVAAMKCKQTTDVENVAALRRALDQFAEAYFTAEDLKKIKHLQEHGEGLDHSHSGGKR
ncbi:MAG: superoxide dismutase [Ni] [Planctomycetota bacterium]